jgi:hypothetical protein
VTLLRLIGVAWLVPLLIGDNDVRLHNSIVSLALRRSDWSLDANVLLDMCRSLTNLEIALHVPLEPNGPTATECAASVFQEPFKTALRLTAVSTVQLEPMRSALAQIDAPLAPLGQPA